MMQEILRQISCLISAIFIADAEPEIWTPDISPRTGRIHCCL
jgi:hypothetical protein